METSERLQEIKIIESSDSCSLADSKALQGDVTLALFGNFYHSLNENVISWPIKQEQEKVAKNQDSLQMKISREFKFLSV